MKVKISDEYLRSDDSIKGFIHARISEHLTCQSTTGCKIGSFGNFQCFSIQESLEESRKQELHRRFLPYLLEEKLRRV